MRISNLKEASYNLPVNSSDDQAMSMKTDLSPFKLGDRPVNRMGYGTMQLSGRGAFGPPRDHAAAVAVLRKAVALGVNHIDTADFYGSHITNKIIREALHPYPDGVIIVTKIGARRGSDGSWNSALSRQDVIQAVHDNLRNLGVDALEVVNLRAMFNPHHPAEGSLDEPLTALADLQRDGLVRHIGLSHVTPKQVNDARRICGIACVQNHYNLDDGLIDDLRRDGIAYVPYFPLGGFTPLQSSALSTVAGNLGATPMQVALAWLLRRAPNILLIPGTSSVAHLGENVAAERLMLPDEELIPLDSIGRPGDKND
jgi:pyridoxine 4-dehydrogenase